MDVSVSVFSVVCIQTMNMEERKSAGAQESTRTLEGPNSRTGWNSLAGIEGSCSSVKNAFLRANDFTKNQK